MRRLTGPVRRVQRFAGYFALLGALGLVAALLVTGAPRLANEYADQGLRQDIRRLPFQTRDLIFTRTLGPGEPVEPVAAAEQLDPIRQRLAAPLPGLVSGQWFAGQIGPQDLDVIRDGPWPSDGCAPELPLRAQPGVDRAARLVAGRWPASEAAAEGQPRVEAVVSREAADVLGLPTGSTVTLIGRRFVAEPVDVRVVGVYEPIDPTAAVWDGIRLADVPCKDPTAGMTWRTPLLTDLAGLANAAERTRDLTYQWRYRVDEQRVTTARIPELLAAIGQAHRADAKSLPRLASGLDGALSTFDRQLRSVRALLAVVQTGLVVCVLGLLVLASRLAVEQRRQEFGLIRARGGTVLAIGVRTLRETVLVLPVAVAAGWALGRLAPGRPAAAELPLVVTLLVATSLAMPVLAALGQRRPGTRATRRDLVRHRSSIGRLTVEALVLLLAVLGLVLLHQRGLHQSNGVDPYLVSAPVLLAVAVALVTLRLVPWPVRQLGRLAARARSVVAFLGLARAGRAAPVTAMPLAVLVVAIATGVFTSTVTSTVRAARDQASDQEIAGDARITSLDTVPETAARLAALPGVTAVSPVAVEPGQPLRAPAPQGRRGSGFDQVLVLVMDGPSLAEVLARSGIKASLPASLTRPGRIDGPVPAVVSPAVAADVGAETAATDVQGRRYEFTVGTVTSRFPGVPVGAQRFVVLPWQAMPVPDFAPIRPNQFLVAGEGFTTAELAATVDAGQRAYLSRLLGQPVDAVRPPPAVVTTWSEHRQTLQRGGVNQLLDVVFRAGTVGTAALALLAVGFTALAGASGRGPLLSRLCALGLSPGQGYGLSVLELVPIVGAAVFSGALVGIALPRLLGPALELTNFTGGMPAHLRFDPLLVIAVPLVVAAAVAIALGVESLISRRARLGEVLRLGEEA